MHYDFDATDPTLDPVSGSAIALQEELVEKGHAVSGWHPGDVRSYAEAIGYVSPAMRDEQLAQAETLRRMIERNA